MVISVTSELPARQSRNFSQDDHDVRKVNLAIGMLLTAYKWCHISVDQIGCRGYVNSRGYPEGLERINHICLAVAS